MRYEIHELHEEFEVSGFSRLGGRHYRSGLFKKADGWTRVMVEDAVRQLLVNTNSTLR